MIKVVCAITLVCITIAAGACWYASSINDELKQAQSKIEILKKSQELAQTAEARAMAARQVENEKARERERLMQNVLDDNCDWSRIELPPGAAWLLEYGQTSDSSFCPPSNAP